MMTQEMRSDQGADSEPNPRNNMLLQLLGLSLVLVCSQGFGNASLALISFPLKVVFKSCKLVPAMFLGLVFLQTKYTVHEYAAAVILCMGLALFTMGDAPSTQESKHLGLLFISLAVFFDALQPILQQKLLMGCTKAQMVLYSNLGSAVLLFLFTLFSGELFAAWSVCLTHPWLLIILILQATTGYIGLGFYLALVKKFGGEPLWPFESDI